jgi:hypothetical protein
MLRGRARPRAEAGQAAVATPTFVGGRRAQLTT